MSSILSLLNERGIELNENFINFYTHITHTAFGIREPNKGGVDPNGFFKG